MLRLVEGLQDDSEEFDVRGLRALIYEPDDTFIPNLFLRPRPERQHRRQARRRMLRYARLVGSGLLNVLLFSAAACCAAYVLLRYLG